MLNQGIHPHPNLPPRWGKGLALSPLKGLAPKVVVGNRGPDPSSPLVGEEQKERGPNHPPPNPLPSRERGFRCKAGCPPISLFPSPAPLLGHWPSISTRIHRRALGVQGAAPPGGGVGVSPALHQKSSWTAAALILPPPSWGRNRRKGDPITLTPTLSHRGGLASKLSF